jgi:hypothetical protein
MRYAGRIWALTEENSRLGSDPTFSTDRNATAAVRRGRALVIQVVNVRGQVLNVRVSIASARGFTTERFDARAA